MAEFFEWLGSVLPSDGLAVEAPFFRGRSSVSLFSMAGIVRLLAKRGDIPLHWYRPTELKKFTGSGRATKGDVIRWAQDNHDRRISDDNEADAVVLMHLHLDRQAVS